MTRTSSAVLIALTVSGLLASGGGAKANSLIAPGMSTGFPLGMPLPEGLYSATIATWGSRSTNPTTDVAAGAPTWLVWSTPWTVLGGRIGLDAVATVAHAASGSPAGINRSGLLNPLLEVSWRISLGGGFHFGLSEGLALPVNSPLTSLDYNGGIANAFPSFVQTVSLTYLNDGWNVTATGFYGNGKSGTVVGKYAPSWVNFDLTATRMSGKWQLGPIVNMSTDLGSPFAGYAKQSQAAVGALVGYNFGPLNVQVKYSRDVYQRNYGGYDSRAWINIIVPIL